MYTREGGGGMVYDVLIWKKNVQNERLQRTNCEIILELPVRQPKAENTLRW